MKTYTRKEIEDLLPRGSWFYNSYSAVFSKVRTEGEEELLDHVPDTCSEKLHTTCESCEGDNTTCPYHDENYDRNSLVCSVPAYVGDTAKREHHDEVVFIAEAPDIIRYLLSQITE